MSTSPSYSPSRSPSTSPSPSLSPSVSPSASPSPSRSPSVSPSASPSPSATPAPVSAFEPTRESIEEVIDYSVLISEFENGAEQRRLKSASPLIGFKIRTPALTKLQMRVYRQFIVDRYGALSSFTFTSPFDDVQYTVRFEQNSFRSTYESGVFVCEFQLKVVP